MDIDTLIKAYLDWLKQEITYTKVGDSYEITSPYLDRNNDYMQIYLSLNRDNSIVMSDDGYIINNLEMSGLNFTKNRKLLLQNIVKRFGVQLTDKVLSTKTDLKNYPQKKHMLLQAMLTVDDMFLTSQSHVSSFFLEDIDAFFQQKDIFCTENAQFTGTSGFTHTYDYVLQRSRAKPERLCRALNSPTKTNVTNVLFSWEDTKSVRRQDSKLVVFLNDENPIGKGTIEGLRNYDAHVVIWSERENPDVLDILVG